MVVKLRKGQRQIMEKIANFLETISKLAGGPRAPVAGHIAEKLTLGGSVALET